MSRIYLDHSSTTPVDPAVLRAMLPYFSDNFGNPSSIHSFGQEAQKAVDVARQKTADFLGSLSQEVIFTGSATEANNLAVLGIVGQIRRQHPKQPLHIIVSAIEHESVLAPARKAERDFGASVTYLPVDREGFVGANALRDALTENTVLVSIMYANNEIGTIQPVAEVAKIISNFRNELRIKNYELSKKSKPIIHNSSFLTPYFHTDAAQGALYLPMKVADLGVDALTLSGHKMYGPKGVGALYFKKGTLLDPLIVGAAQEYGKRAGTENVSCIVGLGEATALIPKWRAKNEELKELRDYFVEKIGERIPRAALNGAPENRLSNNANIRFDGVSSADLTLLLDQEEIAVSAGSACESKAQTDSHVLKALGLSVAQVRSSLRFSLGQATTRDDLDRVIEVLVKLVKKLRNF
ncbi:MAG TPA: cysteine desulfurase family protein [Candidatus Paceibacterota bacterium]